MATVACIMAHLWSSNDDDRPPVYSNYLLETNVVIVDEMNETTICFFSNSMPPSGIVSAFGSTLHNRRHSSSVYFD